MTTCWRLKVRCHQPVRSRYPKDPLAALRDVQGQSWVHVGSPFGIIGQIYFPTDVDTLDDTDMALLEQIVLAYPPVINVRRVHFELYGHADHRFTKEHNQKLSERRAARVKDFLTEQMHPRPLLPTPTLRRPRGARERTRNRSSSRPVRKCSPDSGAPTFWRHRSSRFPHLRARFLRPLAAARAGRRAS